MARGDRVSHHGSAGDRAEVPDGVRGLRPVGAAEVVAGVLAEEGADALGTEVGHAVVAVPRQDDGVREHHLALVDTALQIAEHEVAARHVVAEVAKRLHNLPPRRRVVVPARVAVELLVVLDEGLA